MAILGFDSQPRTRLVFGPNTIDRIGQLAQGLASGVALIVTDAGIVKSGHVERALVSLRQSGFEVVVFDSVRENPTTKDANDCLEIAREAGIGLCLKHFPGIGGAVVDSHQAFMDISDSLRAEQEELFYALAPRMFGDAVLVSHAIVRQWDPDNPMTLSAAGLGRLRRRLPDTLLITDDMQMQGLQQALGTRQACLQSLQAGIDMLCIGNNLFDQELEMAAIAQAIEQGLRDGALAGPSIERSIGRVASRKALLAA